MRVDIMQRYVIFDEIHYDFKLKLEFKENCKFK